VVALPANTLVVLGVRLLDREKAVEAQTKCARLEVAKGAAPASPKK
jgi:hypothetical protein